MDENVRIGVVINWCEKWWKMNWARKVEKDRESELNMDIEVIILLSYINRLVDVYWFILKGDLKVYEIG